MQVTSNKLLGRCKINFQIWTRDWVMGTYHYDKITLGMLFIGQKSVFLQLVLKSKKSIFFYLSDLNFARIEFQLAIDGFKWNLSNEIFMEKNSRGQNFRTISCVGNELQPTQVWYVKIAKITWIFDKMLFFMGENFWTNEVEKLLLRGRIFKMRRRL